jgi:hypothetical protein
VGLPAALARHGSVEAVALVSLTLLPSAPALLIAWAKTQTDLAAIQGTRVGTRLNATLPASRIQRVGGIPTDPWQDRPEIQIEAWAADEATADLLIRTWRAALDLVRQTTAAGRIYTYEITVEPFLAPDDPTLSSNSRYMMSVRLLMTP